MWDKEFDIKLLSFITYRRKHLMNYLRLAHTLLRTRSTFTNDHQAIEVSVEKRPRPKIRRVDYLYRANPIKGWEMAEWETIKDEVASTCLRRYRTSSYYKFIYSVKKCSFFFIIIIIYTYISRLYLWAHQSYLNCWVRL